MTKEEMQMITYPYIANVTLHKESIVSKEKNLYISDIQTHAGNLESTSIVIGSGIDLFVSEYTPLITFDNSEDLNKQQLLLTFLIVLVVTIVLHFVVKKKK